MIVRLIAFCLILESLVTGLSVASLLGLLGGYDAVAIAIILGRGLVGAVQFIGGWLVATHRPQGFVLAQWGLAGAALLTPLDVGLNLAPSGVYPWLRWQVTLGYIAYASAGIWLLARAARRQDAR